jgi:hypothetical protein
VTWAKFGTEFRGQVLMAGLSDAAARTHTEALLWLYEIESQDLRIPRRLVRSFAGSADCEAGIKELVSAEFWRDDGDDYVVLHHADVYRQSLAAQLTHREKEKNRQRLKRANIGANVGTNVRATQSVRQTKDQGVALDLSHEREHDSFVGSAPLAATTQGGSGGTASPPGTVANGSRLATPPHSLREHDGPEHDGPGVQHIPIEVQRQSPATDRYAREAVRQAVLGLRAEGLSYRQIAAKAGCSAGYAHKIVHAAGAA